MPGLFSSGVPPPVPSRPAWMPLSPPFPCDTRLGKHCLTDCPPGCCCCRVRPDVPGLFDGTTASPYEVVFLPLSPAEAEHRLALRTAAKYGQWLAPEVGG